MKFGFLKLNSEHDRRSDIIIINSCFKNYKLLLIKAIELKNHHLGFGVVETYFDRTFLVFNVAKDFYFRVLLNF